MDRAPRRLPPLLLALAFAFGVTSTQARERAASKPKPTSPEAAQFAQRVDSSLAPLATDCASENLRCIDGAVLRVEPNTKFEVLGKVPLQLGDPGTPQVLGRELRLLSGKLEIEVPKDTKKPAPFLIRTSQEPSCLLEQGEGVAIVLANSITFASAEGRMFTTAKERWEPLAEGRARTFTRARPLGDERPLLAVPQIVLARGILMAKHGSPRRELLKLSPVPGAVGYQVSIVRFTKAGPSLFKRVDVRSATVELPVLEPGRYKLRARAVDPYGLTSRYSTPQNLYVLNYKGLGRDDLEDGVIHLGREQRLELLGGEGLEVSYGTASHFVPVPSSIGLNRGRAMVVRFREPDGPEARIRLEPIKEAATIQIGPTLAEWPKDRVIVTVNLFDEHGRPLANNAPIEPEVTINLERPHVQWERRGHVLTGEVPRPVARGPWVVRVVVRNQVGDIIARDFLEIAKGQGRASP